MPSTKLRSQLVGWTMIAFSGGWVVIDLVSFKIQTADNLIKFTAISIALCMLPLFFLLVESPMFLYKRGQVLKLIKYLTKIAQKNKKTENNEDHFKKLIYLETALFR